MNSTDIVSIDIMKKILVKVNLSSSERKVEINFVQYCADNNFPDLL